MTSEELEKLVNSQQGQTLLQAGQQIANGANPTEVGAALFSAFTPPGTSTGDFLQTQGGNLLQQYVGLLQAGEPVADAFGKIAPGAYALGATVALGALGIPPPLSTLMGATLGKFIGDKLGGFVNGIFNGSQSQYDQVLGKGTDKAWRANKYHAKCLPTAFVDWCKANNYSLPQAIANSPEVAPPWEQVSALLGVWLLTGQPWGKPGYILLPGTFYDGAIRARGGVFPRTPGPGRGYFQQLGIGYDLPADMGDGWGVNSWPSGPWYWPQMTAAEMGAQSNAKWGQGLAKIYDDFGIDVPATYANVVLQGSARIEYVIYKKIAYKNAADAIEETNAKVDNGAPLDPGDKAILNAQKGGGAALAALVALAILAT